MKRFLSAILVCIILAAFFSVIPTYAADSDFVVENGVLLSYKGNFTDVIIPDTVSAVGESAFEGNTKLISVTLPSSVNEIGDRAFYGCSSLKTVKGGANVSQTGVHAFFGTPYFDESNDEFFMLGKTLLWYNGDSMYITLPGNCVSVAPYAFLRCKTAKMIRTSSELISVGAGAFYDCSHLESVDLPSSVSYIGAYAFDGTPFIDRLGEFAVLGDGILVRYSGASSDVVIPDGVRRIGSHCFVSSKLKSVAIPESVYSIDPYAFADCVGLSSVTFSKGLSVIGNGAFRGCKALGSLVTPDTLRFIGQYSFNASALRTVRLYGDKLIVADNAFKDCASMKCALLSTGVGAVYDNAFSGCTSLEGISIPVDTTFVGAQALSGCDRVTVTCRENSAADTVLKGNTVNNIIGDADEDGELTILDASLIQCYLAGISDLNGGQTAAADFDFNGVIDILDASDVQLTLAYLM